MTIKVGTVLYQILHEDDGKPTLEQWIVRTIRGGKITAIWKISSTWGKRSTKIGDFGWLPKIPYWARQTWKVGTVPYGLFTTKKKAIDDALKDTVPGDFDSQEIYERHISGLKRMRSRV